jgi:hypothetical protein
MKIKSLKISGQILLEILRLDTANLRAMGKDVSLSGMPEDAKIESVNYDHMIDSLEVFISSDTFEDVPGGQPFPILRVFFKEETIIMEERL